MSREGFNVIEVPRIRLLFISQIDYCQFPRCASTRRAVANRKLSIDNAAPGSTAVKRESRFTKTSANASGGLIPGFIIFG